MVVKVGCILTRTAIWLNRASSAALHQAGARYAC
jgi:hypothetical protein